MHDVSHELRTPVTLPVATSRCSATPAPEVEVALDELGRMERIVERLLRLAASERPDSVFAERDRRRLRRGRVPPLGRGRAARLAAGPLAAGEIRADREALREALDALLENAVKFTAEGDAIDLAGPPPAAERSSSLWPMPAGASLSSAGTYLRALRAGRRRAIPHRGRRWTRPRHRRRHRAGARRPLHGPLVERRNDVYVGPTRLFRARRADTRSRGGVRTSLTS